MGLRKNHPGHREGPRSSPLLLCLLRFDMLKPGCILINVSRGGLVDSEALLDAIENGHVGGAGLDVYENEGKGEKEGKW